MKLQWDDLIIQDLANDLSAKYLGYFGHLVPKMEYRVVFLNKLGEWFVQTRDGYYYKISILSGTRNFIVSDDGQFQSLVNDENWQIENLWSLKVLEWKSSGISIKSDQVYALVPHPNNFNGVISDKVMPMDLALWQWISAQSLGYV